MIGTDGHTTHEYPDTFTGSQKKLFKLDMQIKFITFSLEKVNKQ